MRLALFLGCNVTARVPQYESASRAVLAALGVELVDVPEFNCCGWPLRGLSPVGSLQLAARNLALAERAGLDLVALCQCCFGQLRWARWTLEQQPALRQEVAAWLSREGLSYSGTARALHLLQVLRDQRDSIAPRLSRPLEGLRVAAHYGCHALWPSQVTQFDDPMNPGLLEGLLEAVGAQPVSWKRRLECCGAPAWGVNDEVSLRILERKVADARGAGAQLLCVACPWCHLQFDLVQDIARQEGRIGDGPLPAVGYVQLLGLALGLPEETLGLERNRLSPADGLRSFIP